MENRNEQKVPGDYRAEAGNDSKRPVFGRRQVESAALDGGLPDKSFPQAELCRSGGFLKGEGA